MLKEILKFEPRYKSVIWGGEKIAKLKGIEQPCPNLGESWEISAVPGMETVVSEGALKGEKLSDLCEKYGAELLGEKVVKENGTKFPLLIKIIDAQDNLSVQVHPNDEQAKAMHDSKGKTEMWYILSHEPGANIYSGLSQSLDKDKYASMVADNTIMDAVAAHKSAPGQYYFIPAGTLHAIGAGNLLVEVQQSSDITYRVYDYDRRDANGNPRELHTEQAAKVIDYTFPNNTTPCGQTFPESKDDVIKCQYFSIDNVVLGAEKQPLRHTKESFTIVICVEGEAEISWNGGASVIKTGETVLVPAVIEGLEAKGPATLLVTNC